MSSLKAIVWLSLMASTALCAPPIEPGAPVAGILAEYVRRESANFSWREVAEDPAPALLGLLAPGASIVSLEVTSQVWQGAPWQHRLLVIVPKVEGTVPIANSALLWIAGSGSVDKVIALALPAAQSLGIPCAVLMDVPNQPLLKSLDPAGKGFREDALIATTLVEFQKTGDPDWPLLLPMTRSAVAAMDALAEFSVKRANANWPFGKLERFIVGGASKRGWTTWLTATIDPRVAVILPAVYDNLNIREQLALQRQQYAGGYSHKIHDYVERGIFEMIDTPRGRQVLDLIDPWTYRDAIRAPALMLLATNDEYWAAGGVLRYIDTLKNPVWPFYVTNAGHSLGGGVPVASVVAFVEAVMGLRPLPPSARIELKSGEVIATITGVTWSPSGSESAAASVGSSGEVVAVRVWSALSDDTDLRDEVWKRVDAVRDTEADARGGVIWRAPGSSGADPAVKSIAYTAEVEIKDARGNYSVFSPMIVTAP